MSKITLFIIAGEISGDVHAANIVRELQKTHDVELYGTGGPNLLALGQQQYASVDELAVIGFEQVIRKSPMLLRLAKRIEKGVQDHKPDLILTVDYNHMALLNFFGR